MQSAFDDRLSQILARRDELQALLAEVQPSEYARLAKEFSDLGPVVETIEAYRQARRELGELEALADDPVPTQLYGFTRLGHFELTRARRGATLKAQLEALEKSDD